LNSAYCRCRSASRTFCTMTCFAVCAAMRPKSIGGSGSVMKSPISASELRRFAAASGICVASFSTSSTTSRKRNRRISPLRRSISARMSYSWPYFERPAF